MPSHFPQPLLLLPKWETGKAFIPHRGARRAQLCSWISSARWHASDTTFSSLKAGAKRKQSSELQSLSGKNKQPLCSYCQSPAMSFVSLKAVWFLCSHPLRYSFYLGTALVNEQTPRVYSLWGLWVHLDMEIFSPGCSHRWPWELSVTTKQPLLLNPKAWEVRLAVLLLHRGSGAAGSELCSRK